jgi:hypothetical protein
VRLSVVAALGVERHLKGKSIEIEGVGSFLIVDPSLIVCPSLFVRLFLSCECRFRR